MARIRAATNYGIEPLNAGWQLTELTPGTTLASPTDLDEARSWQSALCPGTVASALREQKTWDFISVRNFDASEWWYRTRFASTPCAAGEALWLELDGLATLADVWLNGTHILRSDNMFVAHELDVSALIGIDNQLHIRFASLDVASAARRPRPRFKTRLVERQQLRWFRTTLLGRIPGWTPPVTPVGPWRAARLSRRRAFSVRSAELRSRIDGDRALVTARVEADLLGRSIESATLYVGDSSSRFSIASDDSVRLTAELEVLAARLWWPNGHGEQPRYPVRVTLVVDGESHDLSLDSIAFRSITCDTSNGRFALAVNGLEIRCRGACWTPADVVSLADDARTLETVEQARAAGMNMLRVGGTMIYESDAFYEACDQAGILVWQDFMFANLDYPSDDEAFCGSVAREAEQFLARNDARACLAVLCGNSEVEQQVAMLGLPRESWTSPLFDSLLRGIADKQRGDVPYVTSTPTGGALPFQPNTGLTHYYGVGAYLRPLEDARRADVKFTPECLGFANIPEDSTIESVLGDGRAPFHNPRWKARVPRDSGPGWDFDDVRDHYTKLLFGIDPTTLRYEDPERALALGRVTSGEVMARTIAEWRSPASNCRGALIWLLRDLWPGAGWGLIDAHGLPKAAYYFVKRAMQARAVFVSDEGLNGLCINAVNDRAEPLTADIELQLIRNGSVRVATGKARVEIGAHGSRSLVAATLFEHFIDLTQAYRFGPRQYDVAVVTLRDADSGALISQASYYPGGLSPEKVEDLGLEATLEQVHGDEWRLRLQSTRFAQAIALDIPGFNLEDSYFDLAPATARTLQLRARTAGATPKGFVRPLNAQTPTRVTASGRGATTP
jgi:beta-mannosidase